MTGRDELADIVPTPELLERLIRARPPCWQWAAFASVLFQRWAAVEERKVRHLMGEPTMTVQWLGTEAEFAEHVLRQTQRVDALLAQAGDVVTSSALEAAFTGDDGEAIVATAHRIADVYECVLGVAQDLRSLTAPRRQTALAVDCLRLANQALQDFGLFVNDVLRRLEDQQRAYVRTGEDAAYAPVPLWVTTDGRLVWAILDHDRPTG